MGCLPLKRLLYTQCLVNGTADRESLVYRINRVMSNPSSTRPAKSQPECLSGFKGLF